MALTMVLPRKAGRPRASPGTVRILKTGVARLSPDLCIAQSFRVGVSLRKKQIVLMRGSGPGSFRLWYSSGAAKSGLLSVMAALEKLGLDAKTIAGEYEAVSDGKKVVIWLRRLRA